ncbi:MAG TPA: glycosyltransferase family 2 protein [Acidobacteriota bacterium]|jgi:glycosyltransferase involved in cell wall biosynthesis
MDRASVVPEISIIVPCYNEARSLKELRERIERVLQPSSSYELIFVDDGSSDDTRAILSSFCDANTRYIRLRRNFGKTAALSVGFREARGKIIVTIDSDLQDQPEEIPRLLDLMERESLDLVSGWKRDRKDPLTKTIPSRIFNWVTARLTGIRIHDFNCGLKAYRREVIEEVKVQGEMHRYIPVLASYRGFRVGEVAVSHAARRHGRSHYGAGRFMGGFFDLLTVIMLTRYNRKPLHAFGVLGVLLATIGVLIETYLTIGWFQGLWWLSQRPAFLLGIVLIIIGIQFIFFGLLAEMIAYSSQRDEDYGAKAVAVRMEFPPEEVRLRKR